MLETPRIIDDVDFNAARDRLENNHPLTTSPRVVNSEILLTGLAHCAKCHSPMRIQTGKSGAYRYYKCGKRADAGNSVCTGCSVRMERLDKTVLGVILDRTLAPGRLDELISPLLERNLDRERTVQNRIKGLKSDKREMKTQLDALWRQISTEDLRLDASLKAYIEKMQTKYEGIARAITRLEFQNKVSPRNLDSKSLSNFSKELRNRLTAEGQSQFRRTYVRSLISRVDVDQEKVQICGSNAVLAGLASGYNQSGRLVPTFVQEWRTGEDSNPRPPDS